MIESEKAAWSIKVNVKSVHVTDCWRWGFELSLLSEGQNRGDRGWLSHWLVVSLVGCPPGYYSKLKERCVII